METCDSQISSLLDRSPPTKDPSGAGSDGGLMRRQKPLGCVSGKHPSQLDIMNLAGIFC